MPPRRGVEKLQAERRALFGGPSASPASSASVAQEAIRRRQLQRQRGGDGVDAMPDTNGRRLSKASLGGPDPDAVSGGAEAGDVDENFP